MSLTAAEITNMTISKKKMVTMKTGLKMLSNCDNYGDDSDELHIPVLSESAGPESGWKHALMMKRGR